MTELVSDYAVAGFRGRLGAGRRPALALVDMCTAYLVAESPLYLPTGAEALGSAVRLLAAARAAAAPVVFTIVRYQPGGADAGLFWSKVRTLRVFEAGSPLGELAPELSPVDGDVVVVKQYASAFFGTSLAATLTARGVDTVVVAGFSTSGCVRATATDALQHGFRPLVVRDAVADRDARPHEANLFDLDAKYADVVGEDEALAVLGRAAR